MITQAYKPALRLDLSPSRQQSGIFWGAHSVAGLLILISGIAWYGQLLAILLGSLHAFLGWHALAWSRRVTQLRVEEGCCEIHLRRVGETGVDVVATEVKPYLVTPNLVILKLNMDGRRHLLSLFRDSTHLDDLRRLRVLLRSRFTRF